MQRNFTPQEIIDNILNLDSIYRAKERSLAENLITETVDEYHYYLVDILVPARYGRYVYPQTAEMILGLGKGDVFELFAEDKLALSEIVSEVDSLLVEINELLEEGLYLEVREEGFCIVYREEVVE